MKPSSLKKGYIQSIWIKSTRSSYYAVNLQALEEEILSLGLLEEAEVPADDGLEKVVEVDEKKVKQRAN